jgi:heme/copper-type cytochrome/quinol oxidase subunit 1
MGYLLLLFAYIYHLIGPDSERTAVLSLLVMTVGGYGFLVMFYIAGVLGVPRRYASYFTIPVESLARAGATTAYLASIFSILLILGVAIYYFSLLKKLRASR